MHLVVFGLSVSSSWGNGHATIWRGLIKGLAHHGHTVSFYEKDVPYYADSRDAWDPPPGTRVHLYDSLDQIRLSAIRDLCSADLAICTSYCPEGAAVARMILDSRATLKAFYDLDTPVTLDALSAQQAVPYLPSDGLSGFDFVLSYTGGRALQELCSRLGARVALPLYGSVDPDTHYPVPPVDAFRATLSYMGTYAADRQHALAEFLIVPAALLPKEKFLIGGAQYPEDFPWKQNIFFMPHLPPGSHPAFFCSSRLTLNVTRRSMANYGHCPSGRLFEAAACGSAIVSDWWEGLDSFFAPCTEILRAQTTSDVLDAISLSDQELSRIAEAARQRALSEHTADKRALELESICQNAINGANQVSVA